MVVATCIVDGGMRARENDTFDIRIRGVLQGALHHWIEQVGAKMITPESVSKADFTVASNNAHEVQVNEKALDIMSYLSSSRGTQMIQQAWRARQPLSFPVKTVQLRNYKEAFTTSSTYKYPYSTV